MKLIFDTNIIHEDFHLIGPRITKLYSAAEKLGYELMVPDVVVDEMVNQYRKKMSQHLQGYASVLKMVSRTQGNEDKFDKEAFLDDKTKEYETFLRKRFKQLNIKIIPYPQIDIKTLISKELKLIKPFREIKNGTIGICDSLIWESVKSVCTPPQALIEEPQIEFITSNVKDFAGTNGLLHSDLVNELINSGLAENCVTLVSIIDEFFKNKVDPELEELDQIKDVLINTGKFKGFELPFETARVLSQDYIEEILNESDSDSGHRYYLPGYIEDPTIEYVNEPFIEDVNVRRLSDQSVLIEVQAKVSVDMNYFVDRANYYLIDEANLPFILDANWNDYYMWCEGSVEIFVLMTFHTTPKLAKILSVDVQVMN